jgi:TRAP-type C4-dicarboxylate transport system permease small subunit
MTSILGAGVLLVLAYYGFAATYDFYLRQVPTLKYLKIPEYLIIIVIPVGCLLFGLQSIRQATGYFKEYRAQKLKKQLRH